MLRHRKVNRRAALLLALLWAVPATAQTTPPNGIYLPGANNLALSANSLEAFSLKSVTTAVDYVEITNGKSGTNPLIAVNGTTANQGLTITATGTGTLTLNGLVIASTGTITTGVWNAGAITSSGALTATAFIPTGSTVPANGMYLPAANKLGFSTNSTAVLTITSTGAVGIGTTTPTGVLSVSAPSSTANATVYGIYETGAMSATNTSGAVYGAYINPSISATTTVTTAVGVQSSPQNTGSGTVSFLYSEALQPQNTSTGTITNMYGSYAVLANTATGTVTNMRALYGRCDNTNASGTVTNCYELYLDTPVTTGAITNKYGVYQTDSASTNYFAGDVTIGTTTVARELTVGGLANGGGIGLVASTTTNHTLSLTNIDDGSSHYWALTPGSSMNQPFTIYSPSSGSSNGLWVRNNGGSFNAVGIYHNDTIGGMYTTNATPLVLSPGSGGVGIGVTPNASARLHVLAASATANDTVYGIYESGAMSATNTSGAVYGVYITPTLTHTTTATQVIGVYSLPKNTSSGAVTALYGYASNPQNTSTGLVTSLYGYTTDLSNTTTGTVTSMYGFWARCNDTISAGTVTNCYGLFLATPAGAGTITNKYGVYQQDSATDNYFAGDIGIGTSAPRAKVNIYSTGQTTAAIDTTSGDMSNMLLVQSSNVAVGDGGGIVFGTRTVGGGTDGLFAAIKSLLGNGAGNSTGDLAFSTRTATADSTLTEQMRITYNGNVGIGTTSPTGKLHVLADSATANSTGYGIYESGAMSATNTSGAVYGAYINPTISATTTVTNVYSMFSRPQNTSSGVVATMIADYAQPQNTSTGTITSLYGVVGQPYKSGTGAVTSMFGLYGQCQNVNATGTVTNCYELYLDTPVTTGAITNKWGVYQVDASTNNYFAGRTAVGTTTTTGVFTVSSPSSTANDTIYGIYQSGAMSATNTSGAVYGAYISPSITATTTVSTVTGIQVFPANASTGTVSTFLGINIGPQNNSTGTVTTMYGAQLIPNNTAGGTVGTMYGVVSIPSKSSTGVVTTMIPLYGRCNNNNATGAVTNCYALYLDTPVETGAITNQYGVYSYCVISVDRGLTVCAARCSTDIGRGFWQARR